MLDDGTYDVLVIDAEVLDADGPLLRVEVTLLDGPRKGDVIAVRASGLALDALDLLGIPGTLTVVGGRPSLAIEP